MRHLSLLRVIHGALPIVLLSCSASNGTQHAPSGLNGSSGAFGGGGGGVGAGPAIDPNGTGGDLGIIGTGPLGGDPTKADGSCAAASASAERVTVQVPVTVEVNEPVALYIMLDQSLSMLEPSGTGTKWSAVTNGISTFVNDPSSAGIDVALGLFPPMFGDPGACDGTGYSTPRVPMGPLPQNGPAIIAGPPPQPTGFGTPTEGGLRGAEAYCIKYQTDHPNEQCAVVFVTDGQPSTCDTNLTNLENVAGDAFKNSHVQTFAVGMAGAAGEVDFSFLNAVAVAGGTNCNPPGAGSEACNIGGGTDLSSALNTIKKTVTQTTYKTEVKSSALACDFTLPAAPPGQVFDQSKVNVQYTDTTGTKEPVYQSATKDACSATAAKSWYYDDPTNPTKILLCPDTCSAINVGLGDGGVLLSDPGVAPQVSVLFGCATIQAPPR